MSPGACRAGNPSGHPGGRRGSCTPPLAAEGSHWREGGREGGREEREGGREGGREGRREKEGREGGKEGE